MTQGWKGLSKNGRNSGRRAASFLIFCGALLLLLSLTLTVSGFYTEAASLSSVQIWLGQELIGSTPGPGGGDLFDQLQLTVEYGNKVIYKGPMSAFGAVREVTSLAGPIVPGQVVVINFTVCLPGPETGNEFQGSSISTRFLVLARCTRPDGRSADCSIKLNPQEIIFNLGNLNPGDCHGRKLEIVVPPLPPLVDDVPPVKPERPVVIPAPVLPPSAAPPLPRTGGYSLLSGVSGLIMILLGAALIKINRD